MICCPAKPPLPDSESETPFPPDEEQSDESATRNGKARADGEVETVERERLYQVVEKLIGSADRALYAAKGTGRAGDQPALRWAEFLVCVQAA